MQDQMSQNAGAIIMAPFVNPFRGSKNGFVKYRHAGYNGPVP